LAVPAGLERRVLRVGLVRLLPNPLLPPQDVVPYPLARLSL